MEEQLFRAVQENNLELFRSLVENGVDVNEIDQWATTPLHYAAEYGYLSIVEYVVEYGANINATDQWGTTPLHYAAVYGNLSIVEFLIDHGADRSIKNICSDTAVVYAKTPEIRHIVETRPGPAWTPNLHHRLTSTQEREQIETLMLIRDKIDSVLSDLPNELMFEIFGNLVK